MSIYASIPGLGDLGDDEQIGLPWIYRGSHIPPTDDGPRGGIIGLGLIPSHITADGRDDQPEDGAPWPWLRIHLAVPGDDPAVLISPTQARHLSEQLVAWADRTELRPEARHTEDQVTDRLTVDTITSDQLDALLCDRDQLRQALTAILAAPDAPSHCHELPAVWDGGGPCVYCTAITAARAALDGSIEPGPAAAEATEPDLPPGFGTVAPCVAPPSTPAKTVSCPHCLGAPPIPRALIADHTAQHHPHHAPHTDQPTE